MLSIGKKKKEMVNLTNELTANANLMRPKKIKVRNEFPDPIHSVT